MADEALRNLSAELGYPSSTKLLEAARRQGYGFTRDEVVAFTKKQSARQVFQAKPKDLGKVVSLGLNNRWAADLIDYTAKPSAAKGGESPYVYILLVQNLYSRELYAHALRVKDPETVSQAFESILRGKKAPDRLDTDAGPEFTGPFDELLKEHNIRHEIADARSKNARASLDNSIRQIRQGLARAQVAEGTRDWAALLPRVVAGFNQTPHSGLVGRAPEDVKDDDDLQFTLDLQAAHNAQHNNRIIKGRAARLERLGAFRDQLGNNDFERAYHPKYGDAVHKVARVTPGGTVYDEAGREFPTKHVLAVEGGSADVGTAGLGMGSAQRDARDVAALAPFSARIVAHVGAGKHIHEMARYMKLIGADAALKNGLNYKRALVLLGLRVDDKGRVSKPGAAVAAPAAPAAARLRLNGKQPAPHIAPPAAAARLRLHGKQGASTAAAA